MREASPTAIHEITLHGIEPLPGDPERGIDAFHGLQQRLQTATTMAERDEEQHGLRGVGLQLAAEQFATFARFSAGLKSCVSTGGGRM
jgi:hypothetical protein